MGSIFLNGQFLPDDQPCISPLDRGFIFGDGVYEVIPAYGGNLFRLEAHLQRLNDSLDAVRIPHPFDPARWAHILQELVRRNEGEDQAVYLQITRGVAPRDHAFPEVEPTVFAMSNPIQPMDEDVKSHGISAIMLDDIRWKYCHIKAIALLPNILLRQQALDADAREAILIRDGEVTEGAASNIFVVSNGTLLTPPRGELLLPGITRDLVLELARSHGIPCKESRLTADDLSKADEIWLTSSTKEILPVTTLDNRPVGSGKPGIMWQTMISHYQACKQAFRDGRIQ